MNGGAATPSPPETEDDFRTPFVDATRAGDIPCFQGDEKAKASDFANYFCSYAQLYHQKQMLADHARMAAYHAAILGNQDVFRDKIVMDIGTGSGILAVWAAQAGARKVYAIEYTDMAKHARTVMKTNQVDHIVTVIQSAVEDVELPVEQDGLAIDDTPNGDNSQRCVDIIVSEWMGYFLLRESMLDSVIRARDKFLKSTGLMFPSHCTMYVAPVVDEKERKANVNEYSAAMADWRDFCSTTAQVYGVDMSCLENDFDREQKEYFQLSSRWMELTPDALLDEPKQIKHLDMATCTIQDSRGISSDAPEAAFEFIVNGDQVEGPVSAIAGWFTSDFKSRTDAAGQAAGAPRLQHPAFLSTGPENGYTHWGQQVFYLTNSIPIMRGEVTTITGHLDMQRTKENSRLYECGIQYRSARRRNDSAPDAPPLMRSAQISQKYIIP